MPHRGFSLLAQLFLGELPERCRQHVRVPSLEKHKVSVICLFQRKVNAVFLRRAFKGFDIRISDFDIGNTRAVPHKLFQRLLAAMGRVPCLAVELQELPQRGLQHLSVQLCRLDCKRNRLSGYFFLQRLSLLSIFLP